MSERKNHNPICPICSKPTRTRDVSQWNNGRKGLPRFNTSCSNMTTCGGRVDTINGHGTTIKESRADFIEQAAKAGL